jgi:hypothetical protein
MMARCHRSLGPTGQEPGTAQAIRRFPRPDRARGGRPIIGVGRSTHLAGSCNACAGRALPSTTFGHESRQSLHEPRYVFARTTAPVLPSIASRTRGQKAATQNRVFERHRQRSARARPPRTRGSHMGTPLAPALRRAIGAINLRSYPCSRLPPRLPAPYCCSLPAITRTIGS